MPVKRTPGLSDFTAGEMAPHFFGLSRGAQSLPGGSLFQNFSPRTGGSYRLRPGTFYAGGTSSNAAARVLPWVLDDSHVYVLELTDTVIRFWKWASGTLTYLSGKDVTSPYLAAELFAVQYSPYYPYLFLVHPSHAPRMLTWSSGDTFAIKAIPFTGASPYFVTATIATGTAFTLTTGSLQPDTPGGSTYANQVGNALTGSGIPAGTTIATVTDSTHFTASASCTNASGVTVGISYPYVAGSTPALPFQSSGNYPSGVCVAFQRVWFLGAANNPLRVWASIVGIFDDQANVQMGVYEYSTYQQTVAVPSTSVSLPTTYTTQTAYQQIVGDADGIQIDIASDRNDSVQWIAPANDLMIGTASGVWSIPASFTANTVSVQGPACRNGSSGLQATMVQSGVIFVSRTGKAVNQLVWQGQNTPLIPPDNLSYYADHLFVGRDIIDWAHSDDPETTLYFVMSDGEMACLTFDAAKTVRAWWRWKTSGTITSACVVPSSDRDVLVTIALRGTNYLIEYSSNVDWYDPTATNDGEEAAMYLDSAYSYSGSATSTITGLTWLEGLTVGVVAKGGYLGTGVVSGSGSLTVPGGGTVTQAFVGLLMDAEYASLPLDYTAYLSYDTDMGIPKSTVMAAVRLYNTLWVEISADNAAWTVPDPLATEDLTVNDPAMFSGDAVLRLAQTPRAPAYIYARTKKPLPCEVTVIVPQIEYPQLGAPA